MTLSYEWLNLEEDEEPISFVMYGSYEEQMQFLKDDQLGKLIRNVYHYVRTGEQKDEEPIINMALSMIAFDIRNQKRNQKKRSGAASIAALAGVEKRAKEKAEKTESEKKKAEKKEADKKKASKKKNPSPETAPASESDSKRSAATVSKYVDEDADVNEDVNADADVNPETSRLLPPSGSAGGCEADAVDNPDALTRYGENQHLTTRGVIVQMEDFAAELVRKYWGRAASQSDVEKVYDKCYMPGTLPNGQWGAVFSTEKAALLRYAFQQAAMQNGCTWSYIEGIYKKFDERRITSVEEAVAKEYEWQRGEIA